MELEVWPNFVLETAKRKIPVVVANGRLTSRSFRRYRLFRFFFKRVFRRLQCVCAQNEDYGERFQQIGVLPERVHITGNMKYDLVPTGNDGSKADAARRRIRIAPGESVIVAGSTHPGEEADVLDAFLSLRKEMPGLRLVIAPRHINRIGEIKDLIWEAGESFYLRSEFAQNPGGEYLDKRIIILDTIGELSEIYRIATVAFVGGSLVQYGGHNILEPAALGVPVVTGLHTYNFADAVALLSDAGALAVVRNGQELQESLRNLLADAALRERIGTRAIAAIEGAKGATRKHLEYIAALAGLDAAKGEVPGNAIR
jgi:3-deoxy-D-manno-octulosonic-acid transferase